MTFERKHKIIQSKKQTLTCFLGFFFVVESNASGSNETSVLILYIVYDM